MAEIATYICSNTRCALTFRVAHNFPVWEHSTPRELRTPSPSKEALGYVTRYRSETFCTQCRSVVEYTKDMKCPTCDVLVHADHADRACIRCAQGAFTLQKLSVF